MVRLRKDRTGPVRNSCHMVHRKSAHPAIAALLVLLAFSVITGFKARAAVLVAEADLPAPAAAFAVADTTASGQYELVAAGADGIYVLAPADDALSAWVVVAHIPPLPAPATAVAVADFIGDGVPSIAVGTAQAGAIYLLRWTGSDWVVAAQTGYLWSAVEMLAAADLSGDGRPELVARDAGGGVTVFTWNAAQRTLSAVWQWPRSWGRAVAVSRRAARHGPTGADRRRRTGTRQRMGVAAGGTRQPGVRMGNAYRPDRGRCAGHRAAGDRVDDRAVAVPVCMGRQPARARRDADQRCA